VIFTVAMIAEKLKVSKTIVYGWVESHELPHFRLGAKGHRGSIRVEETDLQAFMEARKVKGGQEAPQLSVKPRKAKLKHLRLS